MTHVADYRIVVLISGSGTNLQAIMDAAAAGRIQGQIVEVISNRADAYGLERAAKAGITTQVLDHRDHPTRQAYDTVLAEHIETLKPDLIILAGFMRILSDAFVERFMGRLINIHPSLLPAYRGLHTHARAIEAKEPLHGCSVHYVIPELDAGPVIAQAAVTIKADDTPETLQTRVQAMEHQLYPEVVAWLADGRVSMKEQAVWIDGQPIATPPRIGTEPEAVEH